MEHFILFGEFFKIDFQVQEWLKNQAATEINDSSISLIVIQLMLFVDARKIEFGEMFLSNICSDLSDKFSEVKVNSIFNIIIQIKI